MIKKIWKNNIIPVFSLFAYNWKELIGFELIYKAASAVTLLPVFWAILHLTMKLTGYSYLTAENIHRYFTSPITIAGIVLALFLTAVVTLFDISAIIFILDCSRRRLHVRLLQIVKFAAGTTFRVRKHKNRTLLLLALFLIPFLVIGIASGFITTTSLPEFILRRIRKNIPGSIVIGTALLAVSLLQFRLVYVFHYFALEHCSFRESVRRSRQLCKNRLLKNVVLFVLLQIGYYALYLVSVLLTSTVIVLMDLLLSKFIRARWLVSSSVWLVSTVLTVIFAAISVPAGYTIISFLFYRRKKETGEMILPMHGAELYDDGNRHLPRGITLLFGAVVTAGTLVLGYLFGSGAMNPQIEYIRTLEVTAHRGASYTYPENTMPAFEGAVELGADWIELDVQQTADGVIIVSHDTNLKRVTGENIVVWDATYDEIKDLNAGYFFRRGVFDTPIPLLSEVLEFAKENNIRLNIELKPTGHEENFEQHVIDLIREYDFAGHCVVTSQSYRCLERIKEYDEEIETVYVMSMAFGGITRLKYADNFSVRANFITNGLVSAVHNEGKQIYAWTVNYRGNIQKMIDMNVDNIITDNITIARNIINENRTGNLLNQYIRLVRSLF